LQKLGSFKKTFSDGMSEYEEEVRSYYLNVEGMSCSSCEAGLTKKTLALEGVAEASFSALLKQAKIKIDINKISIRKVIQELNGGKFSCALKEKSNKVDIRHTIEEECYHQKNRMMASLLMWIPIMILIWFIPNVHPFNKFVTVFAVPNGPTLYVYMTAFLSLCLTYYLGTPLMKSAWAALKARTSNMDTLVVIGTTASVLYGLSLFFIGYSDAIETEEYSMKTTEHAHFFEVSSTILVIISIGKYIETYAKSKTLQKLSDLASIKVTKACLFTPEKPDAISFSGKEEVIPVELLNKNDLIKVINGQIVPTDCQVVYGQGYCNESMMTGESCLAKKDIDSKVFGGTILEKGSLILRVEVIEEESSLNQILKLVENAQTNKAPIQAYADKISSYFVPLIIMLTILAWAIWFPIVYLIPSATEGIDESKFSYAFTFGISTVVIACPCALGLATPTAVMVCSGIAAGLGILIKGGNILEKSSKIDTVVFDKTGTLTSGIPEVSDVEKYGEEFTLEEAIYLAKVCETESEHPLGKSIVKSFTDKLSQEDIESMKGKFSLKEFENFNGEGIKCELFIKEESQEKEGLEESITVLAGNEKLMHRHSIPPTKDVCRDVEKLEDEGKTVIQVAIGNEVVLVIALQEKHLCKPEAQEVCTYLRNNEFQIHMITGDHKKAAFRIADNLGIKRENVLYRAYPEDKKSKVEYLQRVGRKVMFIGDGVNDSPVLSQSDVGVAINSQNDITVEAADVVIIKDNLISVIDTINLTKKAFQRIKINFFWAFVYNVVLIPVAMGILVAPFQVRLSPHLAAFAMAFSSISVVLSSLMLKLYRPYRW